MRDRKLEKQIRAVEEFLTLWKTFFSCVEKARRKEDVLPQEEEVFLDVKSSIAKKYEVLLNDLMLEPPPDDQTIDLISELVSLKDLAEVTPIQMKKMESRWHSTYIFLNSTMGKLEKRKEDLKRMGSLGVALRSLAHNPVLMILLLLALIIGGFILVGMLKSGETSGGGVSTEAVGKR